MINARHRHEYNSPGSTLRIRSSTNQFTEKSEEGASVPHALTCMPSEAKCLQKNLALIPYYVQHYGRFVAKTQWAPHEETLRSFTTSRLFAMDPSSFCWSTKAWFESSGMESLSPYPYQRRSLESEFEHDFGAVKACES